MASYRAWVTDAESGNKGVYDFEARGDLFNDTLVRIVRNRDFAIWLIE